VSDRPLLLSRREAREYLGADVVGRDALDKLIASGEIRSLRINGRRVAIPRAELERWVAERMTTKEE
jgi:excisionase family DNA binding protein